MFNQMVSDLKLGLLPEEYLLRKRFEAAIIKKMGVIRTPYSFWPADKKINPQARELLWAAVLLNDQDNYRIIEAVVSSELEEKQRAKGNQISNHDLTQKVEQTLEDYIAEFLELAPSETFRKILQQKVETIIRL